MTKNNALYIAALAFSFGWLYYNFQALPAPIDCGDGLMHFFISQASWENPNYFLDHWGKPLFILLSSLFAQFGFDGMVLFNSLVFSLTTILGWQILKKLKTPLPFQLAFPFLLLLTPDYANTVLGGLTEPLFSFFLIAACLAWLNDKYYSFAFLVGCLPFLRSEGQLVVIFTLALLLFSKQWKALYFLVIPFCIYAIIGVFSFSDFWWYFSKSPYSMDNSFYGIGSYWHYLKEFKAYLGLHGLAIFLGGFVVLCFQFFRKQLGFKIIGLVILSYGTFLGILAAHSYFYGSGQNGSMGLTRIATQGLPTFLLMNLYFMGKLLSTSRKQFAFGAFIFPLLILFLLCTTPYLKKENSRINSALITTGNYIKNEPLLKNKTVFAYHPLLAYTLGSNLKMKNQQLQQFSGVTFLQDKSRLTFGDVIVWDSQFGPFEISIPFENFVEDSNLMLCQQEIIPGNLEHNGVFLFQYVPAEIKRKNTVHFIDKTILSKKSISTNAEFKNLLEISPSHESFMISIQCYGAEGAHLVCVPKDNSDYQSQNLHDGKMSFVFAAEANLPYSIYVWNPTKKDYKLEINAVTRKKMILPELWKNGM
jgi:uncharacterized membrane protein